MTDIILSTDDLLVLGGPESINVDVDFGPQGDRGSYILLSLDGNPNEHAIGGNITSQPYDLSINMKETDSEYLYLYQFLDQGGTNTWVKLFRLIPDTYGFVAIKTFTDGSAAVNIPITNIVPEDRIGTVVSSNFNVQYSILGTNPISSAVSVGELVLDNDVLSLPLTLKAVEYDGAWSDLQGSRTVHLLITVI